MSAPARMLGIVEMAARYGVSLRTLRFYEQSGLLKPLRDGSHRVYAPKDRIRLELILKGKRLGFTLQEISTLIEHGDEPTSQDDDPSIVALLDRDAIARQTKFLLNRKEEIDRAIVELRDALVRISAVA